MKVINLRDIYPHYTQDCFVEVTDEVADLFSEFDRKEAAYRLRTYRHKAYYSLDRNDGIEHEALFVALSPHDLYERKVTTPTKKLKNWTLAARLFQRRLQNCPLKQCHPKRNRSFPISLTTGTALILRTREKPLTA